MHLIDRNRKKVGEDGDDDKMRGEYKRNAMKNERDNHRGKNYTESVTRETWGEERSGRRKQG